MGVIYKITSPTGRLYVGKTKHLTRRLNTYKYNIKNNVGWKNSMIMNSLQKYGWEAHKFEIIEECENDFLNEREIYWIKKLNTYCFENPKNMNMSRGGEEGGRTWMYDIERRKKQSERFKGEGGTFYGKKHTEETKKYMSKFMSNRNKKLGIKVPEWGAEKGRAVVRKRVIVYNNTGCFLQEFMSLTEAARVLKINRVSVSYSLKRGSWVLGKYLFKYKAENYPLTIEVEKIKVKQEKRPVLYLSSQYKIIGEFKSSFDAAMAIGVPKTTVNRASMYNWLKPIMSGHIFIYKDLYKEALIKAKKGEVNKARNQNVKSRYHQLRYLRMKNKSQNRPVTGEQSS